jgi:hypothetical protein
MLKTCECGCNRQFEAKRRNQRFFNDEHRDIWYKEHYFGQVEMEIVCPVCHEPFTTTCSNKKIYNTDECAKTAAKNIRYGLPVDSKELGPGTCQLCGMASKNVGPHKGIKLCLSCLTIADGVDTRLAKKYEDMILVKAEV